MKQIFFFLSLIIFSFSTAQIPADRLVDWSMAGASSVNWNSLATEFASSHGLSETDPTANVAAINAAISALGANGGVVIIPNGEYTLKGQVLVPSNIYIIGSGVAQTKIILDMDTNQNGFRFNGSAESTSSAITEAVVKGNNQIKITAGSGLQSGDWIHIIQDDAALVNNSWAEGTVGQIVQIASINGGQITIAGSLRLDIPLGNNPRVVKINPVENSGISCMTIERQDPETIGTTSNIYFNYAINCQVENVHSIFCKYSHIQARYSAHIEVRNCYFEQSFSYGGGGNGYGVMLHQGTGDCLVTNNIFRSLRHAMIVQSGANGNVFAYNYSKETIRTEYPSDAGGDIVCHGNYPYANLFEHNICQNMQVDNSHGANGPFNTFFRNRAENWGMVVTDPDGESMNIVGNDITKTGGVQALFNYIIPSDLDYFVYGNNDKGTIKPSGTSNLTTQSLYLNAVPAGWGTYYSTIGTPNTFGSGSVEAYDRYQANQYTTACEYWGALPVTLEDFSLRAEGEIVTIDWKTHAEDEVDVYVVERFENSVWSEVARISPDNHTYTIADDRAQEGLNIYRLLCIYYDGRREVLAVDSIEVVYTSIDDHTITFMERSDKEIRLLAPFISCQLLDITGRVIKNFNPANQVTIDLETYRTSTMKILVVIWENGQKSVIKITPSG